MEITQQKIFRFLISGEHLFSVVKLKDGRHIKVDSEWELESIKTGLSWSKFGTKEPHETNLSMLTNEEVNNTMKKIGYINNESDYFEEYCQKLYSTKLDGKSLKDKLNIIFDDKEILSKANKLSASVEVYRFYRLILKKLTKQENTDVTSHEFNKNIYLFGVVLKDAKNKKYSVCAYMKYKEQNEKKVWLYSNNLKRMVEATPIELNYYRKTGKLDFVPGKQVDALEDLNNYIEERSKNFSSKANLMSAAERVR